MAIRKTNDIANETDSKYSNQRGKRTRIEERLDDTTSTPKIFFTCLWEWDH